MKNGIVVSSLLFSMVFGVAVTGCRDDKREREYSNSARGINLTNLLVPGTSKSTLVGALGRPFLEVPLEGGMEIVDFNLKEVGPSRLSAYFTNGMLKAFSWVSTEVTGPGVTLAGSAHTPSEQSKRFSSSKRLSFYFVAPTSSVASVYVNTESLPDLGYIGETPAFETSQTFAWSWLSNSAEPSVSIQLQGEDIPKLKKLTESALGSRLLLTIDQTPLYAPVISTPLTTGHIHLRFPNISMATKFSSVLDSFSRTNEAPSLSPADTLDHGTSRMPAQR